MSLATAPDRPLCGQIAEQRGVSAGLDGRQVYRGFAQLVDEACRGFSGFARPERIAGEFDCSQQMSVKNVADGEHVVAQRLFERAERRRDVCEPVLQIRKPLLPDIAFVVAFALDRDLNAAESCIRSWTAQEP